MQKVLILTGFLLISCGLPPQQKAMKILQDGIMDESNIVRVNAAKSLKQIGDAQGIRILYDILEGDDQESVVAAIGALYDLKENTVSPIVVKLTKNHDPLIRAEACRLVSSINDEKARDILIKGTSDEIAKIRRLSYLGLEKFKEKKVIRNGLRDIDPLVRIASAKVLANLGEEGMENLIKKEMEITNIEVWKQGVIALAEMGDTSTISFIKGLIEDAPWELRIAAAEALLIFNDKEGVAILKEGLKSNDPFTRIEAVDVFKRYNIPDASEALKEAVHDEFINVSIIAIEALTIYRTPECNKIFIEMMDAPNPMVKIAAASAFLQSLPLRSTPAE
jgi:HEAT repeat protein